MGSYRGPGRFAAGPRFTGYSLLVEQNSFDVPLARPMAVREQSESGGSPSAGGAAAGTGGRGIRNLPEVSAGLAAAGAENRNCRSIPRPVGGAFTWWQRCRRPPYLSKLARMCKFAPGVLFFWTVHGPFSFRQDRKENGGWNDPAIIMAVFPAQWSGPFAWEALPPPQSGGIPRPMGRPRRIAPTTSKF